MKTLDTPLPGLVLLELDVFDDARGRFQETFHRARYLEHGVGIGLEFVQDNFSSSVRGSLRGLHYQAPNPQGKLVHVTRGEVFDVVVDLRRGSPTYRRWYGTTLSADNHRQLWVPPGFAHGLLVTSESADVVYKVTAFYAPTDDRAIAWNDPELAISWPIDGEPLLSAKDRAAPRLADAALP